MQQSSPGSIAFWLVFWIPPAALSSSYITPIVWTPAPRGEIADKMPREFNWHIKRPQYGSRRLALKNHVVAAVGEVSATDAPYRDHFRP